MRDPLDAWLARVVPVSGDQPLYSIGAVAAMLGTMPATLRSWEERYALVEPERTQGGRRLYSRVDVERLRFVKETIARGFSAADAHRLLRDRLEDRDSSDAGAAQATSTEPLVLLAERDPYGAALSEHSLRSEGYAVELALNAGDAEHTFREHHPAMAIVEMMISGGVGADLCARLKEIAQVPVLAVSSLDAREQALDAGADNFLPKPLDPLQLVSAVKGLLGQSALLRGSGP